MRRTCGRLLQLAAYVPKRAGTPAVAITAEARLPRGTDVTVAFRATERAAFAAEEAKKRRGFFSLPIVPYPTHEGLPPVLSKAQLDVRVHVHLQHHVDRLNELTLGSEVEGHAIDVVIARTAFDATQSGIHAAACEYFNSCFALNSMRPWGCPVPPAIAERIQVQFGGGRSLAEGLASLEAAFTRACLSAQHGGWVWLALNPVTARLEVFSCEAGLTLPTATLVPLLCIDVQEHSFAVDYDCDSGPDGLVQYVANFWKAANWQLAERYLTMATNGEQRGMLL